jgi:hypothetical protein
VRRPHLRRAPRHRQRPLLEVGRHRLCLPLAPQGHIVHGGLVAAEAGGGGGGRDCGGRAGRHLRAAGPRGSQVRLASCQGGTMEERGGVGG